MVFISLDASFELAASELGATLLGSIDYATVVAFMDAESTISRAPSSFYRFGQLLTGLCSSSLAGSAGDNTFLKTLAVFWSFTWTRYQLRSSVC